MERVWKLYILVLISMISLVTITVEYDVSISYPIIANIKVNHSYMIDNSPVENITLSYKQFHINLIVRCDYFIVNNITTIKAYIGPTFITFLNNIEGYNMPYGCN